MKCRYLFLLITLVGWNAALFACEGTVPPIDYAGTWPRQIYRLTVIAPEGHKGGEAMVATIRAFLKGDGKDCNLELQRVNAGSADGDAVAVLTDPSGKSLTSFTGKVTADDLKKLTTSPARDKIAKGLLDYPLMLLLIEGSDDEANAEALKTAKHAVKMATELFPREQLPAAPPIIRVRAADAAESGFMSVLGVPTNLKTPRMTMLIGNGMVVETPSTKITEERVLDRVQRLVAALEVVFPFMFQHDILMPIPDALLP